ncbi:transposase [Candidatus Kaiserbacteria bacterium]|nr:transposase [Candidatus Kaiserbacteria bacterium]
MELFHALNRGVDKRTIFMDERDNTRFVHDLYEFNDASPAINMKYHIAGKKSQSGPGRRPATKKRIVDIHGWCLMKNHYHLLLSEVIEGGMSLFLRKLNVGYANYFNERHKRTGTLFQGRTKKVLIEHDSHFLYILHYIHLNPLDFRTGARKWREGTIDDIASALTHLKKYRWSSYLDYCGEHNFPSVVTMDLFSDVFKNYESDLRKYVGSFKISEAPNNLE